MYYDYLTYDNATTVLGWAMFLTPFALLLAGGVYGLGAVKAVFLVLPGRAARREELALWGAYYDKCQEKEDLEKRAKEAKERHQADMKAAVSSGDPALKRAAPLVYVAACQAEDKKVDDFDRDEVKPAKRAADGATKDRRWYTSRTWREMVMTR